MDLLLIQWGHELALGAAMTVGIAVTTLPFGLGLGLGKTAAMDPKAASLLRLGVAIAIGSAPVCIEWSASRALAAGATEDEIADVLLAIAPVTGLGRVVCAAPDVAIALGYDVAAALEELDDP